MAFQTRDDLLLLFRPPWWLWKERHLVYDQGKATRIASTTARSGGCGLGDLWTSLAAKPGGANDDLGRSTIYFGSNRPGDLDYDICENDGPALGELATRRDGHARMERHRFRQASDVWARSAWKGQIASPKSGRLRYCDSRTGRARRSDDDATICAICPWRFSQ